MNSKFEEPDENQSFMMMMRDFLQIFLADFHFFDWDFLATAIVSEILKSFTDNHEQIRALEEQFFMMIMGKVNESKNFIVVFPPLYLQMRSAAFLWVV